MLQPRRCFVSFLVDGLIAAEAEVMAQRVQEKGHE
jgi:hypothetical protein